MTRSKSFAKICGSLRKTRSGWWASMKCLRLKIFLPRPSIFQVRATKELVEEKEESVDSGDGASAKVAELSDPMSLTALAGLDLLENQG